MNGLSDSWRRFYCDTESAVLCVVCIDTNECLEDNVCGRGQCVNVDGGFECRCEDGYVPGADGTCEGS